MSCRGVVGVRAIVVVDIPPAEQGCWSIATALSGGCLTLMEEPLRHLLRLVKGRIVHCRRSRRRGLAPAGVGGAVAKRPLLGELAAKVAAVYTVVTERSRAHTMVSSRSLRTHFGATSTLANTERRSAMRRLYIACCRATCSASDTVARESEAPS